MIILLVTNKEYLMDSIKNYLTEETYKLLIATTFPDNYDFYDIIITDYTDNLPTINNPIIFITDSSFQWIRSYNAYNLLLPLKKEDLLSIVHNIAVQKVNYYPYINIEDKYNNYNEIFKTLHQLKQTQEDFHQYQDTLQGFYKKINQQFNNLQENFTNNYEKLFRSNEEIHEKINNFPNFKVIKNTYEKIYRNKIILNFNKLNIYDWYNSWVDTLKIQDFIKKKITNSVINLVQLLYFYYDKNFQEIIIDISYYIQDNQSFFKIQLINENSWDPKVLIFLQNYYNLSMTITHEKKIFFSDKIINIKDIISI